MGEPGGSGRSRAGWAARGFHHGVRLLLILAACGALPLLGWRLVRDMESKPVRDQTLALRSEDADERLVAARELGAVPPGEVGLAVPALAEALGDSSDRVRVEAVFALGSAGSTAAGSPNKAAEAHASVKALMGAMQDPNAEVRVGAIRNLFTVLGASGTSLPCDVQEVGEALSRALADPMPEVRASAARGPRFVAISRSMEAAMTGAAGRPPRPARIRYPVAPAPALISALQADPSPEVRAEAASTLGGFHTGDASALPPLFEALEHGADPVRWACAGALGEWDHAPPPELIPLLIDKLGDRCDPRVRCYASSLLAQLGQGAASALPSLVDMIRKDPNTDPKGVGPELLTGEWDPVCWAVKALTDIVGDSGPSSDVVEALAVAVRSPKAQRRVVAAEALGEFGPKGSAAVPALIATLHDALKANPQDEIDGDEAARTLGLVALGTPHAEAAVRALTVALDSDSPVRYTALDALRRFGRDASAATPRLRAASEDSDQEFRREAAKTLRIIEGSEGAASPPPP